MREGAGLWRTRRLWLALRRVAVRLARRRPPVLFVNFTVFLSVSDAGGVYSDSLAYDCD
jgi:hypothetical protein